MKKNEFLYWVEWIKVRWPNAKLVELSIKSLYTDFQIYSDEVFGKCMIEYFDQFNRSLHGTDVLWTKPSELSFYCALGIPIVMSQVIGSQERFNRKWLREIQAALKQEKPDYTDQWLFDLLNRGTLAESAWDGFLKARKLGTFRILEMLESGKIIRETHPVFR